MRTVHPAGFFKWKTCADQALPFFPLKPDGTEEIYYYDEAGRRLGSYRVIYAGGGSPATLYMGLAMNSSGVVEATSVYFGSRLLQSTQGTVVQDRLSSVVSTTWATPRYYPYGEEYAATAQVRRRGIGQHTIEKALYDKVRMRSYKNILAAIEEYKAAQK